MNDVQVRVFSQPVRGQRKLVASTVCDESLAHDELRDLLHAAGVERPERAILEGPPVYDGGLTNEITWEVDYLDEKEGQ